MEGDKEGMSGTDPIDDEERQVLEEKRSEPAKNNGEISQIFNKQRVNLVSM